MWIDASVCPLSLRSRTVPVVCASVRLSPGVRLFLALCLVRGLCLCLYLRLRFARSLERAPAAGRTAGFRVRTLSRARTAQALAGRVMRSTKRMENVLLAAVLPASPSTLAGGAGVPDDL